MQDLRIELQFIEQLLSQTEGYPSPNDIIEPMSDSFAYSEKNHNIVAVIDFDERARKNPDMFYRGLSVGRSRLKYDMMNKVFDILPKEIKPKNPYKGIVLNDTTLDVLLWGLETSNDQYLSVQFFGAEGSISSQYLTLPEVKDGKIELTFSCYMDITSLDAQIVEV